MIVLPRILVRHLHPSRVELIQHQGCCHCFRIEKQTRTCKLTSLHWVFKLSLFKQRMLSATDILKPYSERWCLRPLYIRIISAGVRHTLQADQPSEKGTTSPGINSTWMRRHLADSIYIWACGEKADDEDEHPKLSDRFIAWLILFLSRPTTTQMRNHIIVFLRSLSRI